MRDPKRIPEVLKAVQAAWEKNPDWRLGQLLVILASHSGHKDVFYVEDDVFLRGAEKLSKGGAA